MGDLLVDLAVAGIKSAVTGIVHAVSGSGSSSGSTVNGPAPTPTTTSTTTSPGQPTPQPNVTPQKAKFNLPPHLWSRPLTPELLMNDGPLNYTPPSQGWTGNEAYRLSRMWCYQPTPSGYISNVTNSSNSSEFTSPRPAATVSGGRANSSRGPIPLAPSTNQTLSNGLTAQSFDYDWGFQFLWNPTNISTQIVLNNNVTPSAVDKYSGIAGLFNAVENINFTIVIDRVNDFACARGLLSAQQKNYGTSSTINAALSTSSGAFIGFSPIATTLSTADVNILTKYYQGGAVSTSSPSNPEALSDQIFNLLKLGTMADVEYIYKMMNGSGVGASGAAGSTYWTNMLGKKTADISFIQPTPIAVQFGPSIHSLSYVGYIESMSINHTIFTQDMIPLHTEIQVAMNAFSKTTLISGGI
jgi:hypothetical protein